MKLIKLILFSFILSIHTVAVAQEKDGQQLLSTVGSEKKWKSLNYILFSSNTANSNFLQRSFLLDKQTGKVRLDAVLTGDQSLVLLFNFKYKVVDKCYINGQLADVNTLKVPFSEILSQFFQDTELLFLPMFVLSIPKSNLYIKTDQIINTERLVKISFRGASNFNKDNITGALFLNNKGQLKEYEINQENIVVSDIKDIGDGILLPTSFNFANTKTSVKFNIVAAFTDVELSRFSNL